MSEKIEFEVTAEVVEAAAKAMADVDVPDRGWKNMGKSERDAYRMLADTALAHPSFQSQLRAYVAGEARRLLAGPYMYHHKMNELQERYAQGFDRCRELSLANIAAYEKEQEDD